MPLWSLFCLNARDYVLDAAIGLNLFPYLLFDYVARNMHEGITISWVLIHAGQTRVMVMEQAGFLLGIVGGDANKVLGHIPGTTTDGIPQHFNRLNGANSGVNLYPKLRPAKVAGEFGQVGIAIFNFLAAPYQVMVRSEGTEGLRGDTGYPHFSKPLPKLAGKPRRKPFLVVHSYQNCFGPGHLDNFRKQFRYAWMLGERED
jgi:hypothetical protein